MFRDYFDEHVRPELRTVRRGRRVFIAVAELEGWLDPNGARRQRGRVNRGNLHDPARSPGAATCEMGHPCRKQLPRPLPRLSIVAGRGRLGRRCFGGGADRARTEYVLFGYLHLKGSRHYPSPQGLGSIGRSSPALSAASAPLPLWIAEQTGGLAAPVEKVEREEPADGSRD